MARDVLELLMAAPSVSPPSVGGRLYTFGDLWVLEGRGHMCSHVSDVLVESGVPFPWRIARAVSLALNGNSLLAVIDLAHRSASPNSAGSNDHERSTRP